MLTCSYSDRYGLGQVSPFTWLGLTIALFGMIIVRQTISYFYPALTVHAAVLKESLTWLCVFALWFIVRRGEGLSLQSVGIDTSRWLKSVAWGLVLTAVLIAIGTVADLIAILSHYHENEFAREFNRLPVWLVTLTCVRAGVGEELFYRGYAIERLLAVGLSRFWAATIPVVIFAIGHWTSGWPNILAALVVGSGLSIFYLWRRDLIANMVSHFLVDFIGVVIPRLLS